MDWIILISAAFGAGVLNTIAGGGIFLTFPALVFAGLSPVAANATSAVAVLPGYLSGTIGFARELRTIERALILSAIGGYAGADPERHRRIRRRANCQGLAPIRSASDRDCGWIWRVRYFLCTPVFMKFQVPRKVTSTCPPNLMRIIRFNLIIHLHF